MSDDRRDERNGADAEAPRESWLDRLIGRLGLRPRESVREDLQEALEEAAEAAELSEHERAMLTNVLAFHRVLVSDVMVPRADIIAVSSETSLGELLGAFRAAGHSRLPAYGQSLDEPLGMVHIRDLVNYIAAQGEFAPAEPGEDAQLTSLAGVDLSASLSSASILRPVLFVPGAMPAIDLLARMQASRTHIALVIDEYGGTDGLVSLEDLVESVVGNIEDEHDETADMVVEDEGGGFLVDARASIEEVGILLGQDLLGPDDAEEVDTVGGLLVTRAGRVPLRGERLAGPDGVEFEVLDADRRRLKRLRIRRPGLEGERAAPSQGAEPGAVGAVGPG